MDRLDDVSSFWRDLVRSGRSLSRAPGFTLTAAVTLALGIGANSAVFSVASGTLLNPIPWREPSTIVDLSDRHTQSGERRSVSTGRYVDLGRQAKSLAGICGATPTRVQIGDDSDGRVVVQAARVTANSFRLLGLSPILGRPLVESDGEVGAERVAVVSEGLWRGRYAGAADIIGRRIEIDGRPVTVVGVQGASEWFPWPWTDVVLPLPNSLPQRSRVDHRLVTYGRLAPASSLAEVRAELKVISRRLSEELPGTDREWVFHAGLARDQVVRGPMRLAIRVLFWAVAGVLLIACANVANLLLTRAAHREKELAIRGALGATRVQIVSQLLAEALVLAALALPPALLLTYCLIQLFLSLVPPSAAYMTEIFRFDLPVIAFCSAVTFGTIVAFALLPTLQATRVDLHLVLQAGGDRGSTARGGDAMRRAVVVAQIALALALLVCSSLLAQSFLKLESADPRFAHEDLIVTSFNLDASKYPERAHQRAFHRSLLASLESVPDVEAAATINFPPFDTSAAEIEFELRRAGRQSAGSRPRSSFYNVTPNYFEVIGVPILRGRRFDETDSESSRPVALVNEALERRYFAESGAVGEFISFRGSSKDAERTHEIVGVVADHAERGIGQDVTPSVYVPYVQQPWTHMSLVIRSRNPGSAVSLVRNAISALDSGLATTTFETMRERIERSKWQTRLFSFVIAALGLVAVVLSAVGVFGVVSYSSARRAREFGIRSALGADRGALARLVLIEGAALGGAGAAIGLVASVALTRLLRSLLYGVSPLDPATFTGVAVLLVALALSACALPALRAARADPIRALRSD